MAAQGQGIPQRDLVTDACPIQPLSNQAHHNYPHTMMNQNQPYPDQPHYGQHRSHQSPFAGVPPTYEHYDAALVFAKGDDELADDIMNKMNNLELKNSSYPKVCLSDDPAFGAAAVSKADPIVNMCTLIFVVLTENLQEDAAAAVLREEAIGMTRLAPKYEVGERRRYCVRPLHTLSEKERRGVYKVPCGLTSIDSIDWYQFKKPFFQRKLKQLFEFHLPYRLKREMQTSEGGPVQTSSYNPSDNHPASGSSSGFQYDPMHNQQLQQNIQGQSSGILPSSTIFPPSNERTAQPSLNNAHVTGSSVNNMTQNAANGSGVLAPAQQGSFASDNDHSLRSNSQLGSGSPSTSGSQTAVPESNNHRPTSDTFATPCPMALSAGRIIEQASSGSDNDHRLRSNRPSSGYQPTMPTSGQQLTQAPEHRPVESEGHASDQHSATNMHEPNAMTEVRTTARSVSSFENLPVSNHAAREEGDQGLSVDAPPSLQGNDHTEPKQLYDDHDSIKVGAKSPESRESSLQYSATNIKFTGSEAPANNSSGTGTPQTSSLQHNDEGHQTEVKISTGHGESSKPSTNIARTPGDGQSHDINMDSKPVTSQTSSSQTEEPMVVDVEREVTDGKKNPVTETMHVMKGGGSAHRSAKCGAPNTAHLEKEALPSVIGPEFEPNKTREPIIHLHYMAGQYVGGSQDPKFFPMVPPGLLQGLPPYHTGGAAGFQTQSPRVRTTGRHGDEVKPVQGPIYINNCENVQIGTGVINIKKQGTSHAYEPDSSDNEDNDDSFTSTAGPGDHPPPYSRTDPVSRMDRQENQESSQADDSHSPPELPSTLVKERISGPVVTPMETNQPLTGLSLARDGLPSGSLSEEDVKHLRDVGNEAMPELVGGNSELGESDFSSFTISTMPSLHDTGNDLREMLQSPDNMAGNAKGETIHEQNPPRSEEKICPMITEGACTNSSMDKLCSFPSLFSRDKRREDVFLNSGKKMIETVGMKRAQSVFSGEADVD